MGKNKQLRKEHNRKVQSESTAVTLSEYEKKLEVLTDQMGKISSRISALTRANRVSHISLSYLQEAPEEVYYAQVGRCFVHTPVGTLREDLLETNLNSETLLPKLQTTLKQFDHLRKETLLAVKELTESLKHSS